MSAMKKSSARMTGEQMDRLAMRLFFAGAIAADVVSPTKAPAPHPITMSKKNVATTPLMKPTSNPVGSMSNHLSTFIS